MTQLNLQSMTKIYEAPPIIERVATVAVDMTPESFEEKFEQWQNLVIEEYPKETPLVEWKLNMEENEYGIPNLDTMNPELRITHRFSRKTAVDGFDWSIRCPVGRIAINMHSRPGDGRGYGGTMRKELEKWIPAWLKHFDVERSKYVSLHYVNMLRRDITPDLFDDDGSLRLGNALTIFSNVPGEHEHLEPPFDCQVGVRLNGHDDAHLRVHVCSEGNAQSGPAVRVSFTARAALDQNARSEDTLRLLDWCHDRITERFEVVFTDEAKETFSPKSS